MDLTKIVDTETVVEASRRTGSWKQAIIDYLYHRPEFTATVEEILEATDHNYVEGSNSAKRAHCLASQLTYMRQDLNVETFRPKKGSVTLLGLRNDTGDINPFIVPEIEDEVTAE